MKIETQTAVVQSNIKFSQTVRMSIDELRSDHMMKMVTDMYEEPYAAVPREYISNAFDAHIKCGQTKPVQVTLPSDLNPNFIVKDFGVGMSRQEMTEIYSKFGASTKNDNNDEIGGFGLGAKSALALVSQFTVISVQDGRKNTVIISKDNRGIGELNFLEETDTKEPNGVTITIPIPNASRLHTATKEYATFLGWPLGSIEVNGAPVVQSVHNVDAFAKIAEGSWVKNEVVGTNTAKAHYGYGGNLIVLVGPVAYIVPFDKVDRNLLNNEYAQIHRAGVISVNIGDVEFTPSRDTFVYSDKTVKALTKAVKQFDVDFAQYVQNEIEKAPTAKEAFALAKAVRANTQGRFKDLKWRGETIPSNRFFMKDAFHSNFYTKSGALTEMKNEAHYSNVDADRHILVHSISGDDVQIANNLRRDYGKGVDNTHLSGVIFTSKTEAEFDKWVAPRVAEIISGADFIEKARAFRTEKNRLARLARGTAPTQTEAERIEKMTVSVIGLGGSRDFTKDTQRVKFIDPVAQIVFFQMDKDAATAEGKFDDLAARVVNSDDGVDYNDRQTVRSAMAMVQSYYARKGVTVRFVRYAANQKVELLKKARPTAITLGEAMNDTFKAYAAGDSVFNDVWVRLYSDGGTDALSWVDAFDSAVSVAKLDSIKDKETLAWVKAVVAGADGTNRTANLTFASLHSELARLAKNDKVTFKSLKAVRKRIEKSYTRSYPLLKLVSVDYRNRSTQNAVEIVEYINMKDATSAK